MFNYLACALQSEFEYRYRSKLITQSLLFLSLTHKRPSKRLIMVPWPVWYLPSKRYSRTRNQSLNSINCLNFAQVQIITLSHFLTNFLKREADFVLYLFQSIAFKIIERKFHNCEGYHGSQLVTNYFIIRRQRKNESQRKSSFQVSGNKKTMLLWQIILGN